MFHFTLISVWFYFVTRSQKTSSYILVRIEKPNVVRESYLHMHAEEHVSKIEHCLQLTVIEYIE